MKTCPRCGGQMIQRYDRPTGQRRGWNCKPCASARARAVRVNTPDAYLDSKLWTFYRIRLSDFRRMVDEQGGACKACREIPSPDRNGIAGTGLCIDHDHKCCPSQRTAGSGGGRICGRCIRGLLCQQCNVALGMVRDDLDRLRRLVEYLEGHQTSSPASMATRRRASSSNRSNSARLSRNAG